MFWGIYTTLVLGKDSTYNNNNTTCKRTYFSIINLYIPLSVSRWLGELLMAIAINAIYENGGFSGRCVVLTNENGNDQNDPARPMYGFDP